MKLQANYAYGSKPGSGLGWPVVAALPVPVFGQRECECGNTSLKAVLWYHGKRFSARRLGRLAGVTSEGTDHAGLIRAAIWAGARSVFTKRGGTLAELRWLVRAGYPIIVGWWSRGPGDQHLDMSWPIHVRRERDCGHYSVVTDVTEDRVMMMDPQWHLRDGRWRVVGNCSMPRREFLEAWYDTDTYRYRRIDRWYMVVNFSGQHFAGRFPGGIDHGPEPLRRRWC
jgi:predicted double-glycine peptidase